MGLLDQVVGAVAGQLGASKADGNPLLQMVMQLIQNQPGGLQGLVEQFTRAGLGAQAQSWVGTGANQPVSPDDLLSALGGEGGQLGQLVSQLGLDRNEALGGLAQMLPQVVDKLTPNGRIETGGLEKGLGGLLDQFR
jgi:uncharacterized protein YidB (DUF937 family)